jgi:hypothetical protein
MAWRNTWTPDLRSVLRLNIDSAIACGVTSSRLVDPPDWADGMPVT